MIALLPTEVVKLSTEKVTHLGKSLFANFSRSRLELIQLRIALARELSLRSLAVQFGIRAVVKSCMHIDPYLRVRIPLILWRFGSFGQAEANEELVERGKIGIGRTWLSPGGAR